MEKPLLRRSRGPAPCVSLDPSGSRAALIAPCARDSNDTGGCGALEDDDGVAKPEDEGDEKRGVAEAAFWLERSAGIFYHFGVWWFPAQGPTGSNHPKKSLLPPLRHLSPDGAIDHEDWSGNRLRQEKKLMPRLEPQL